MSTTRQHESAVIERTKRVTTALAIAVAMLGCATEGAKSNSTQTPVSGIKSGIGGPSVELALRHHREEFRECYDQKYLGQADAPVGKVFTTFVIGNNGRVTSLKIESSTLRAPEVENCVLGIIKTIEFPKPANGAIVKVEYPFSFSQGVKSDQ